MREAELMALVEAELPGLQKRYHLAEWWIQVGVARQLPNGHIAECHLDEPRRVAQIWMLRRWLRSAEREEVLSVLEHEVHHVLLYPLEALRDLVVSLVDDSAVDAVEKEFVRCNERLRSMIGRLTQRGNNWEFGASFPKEGGHGE